MGFYTHALQDGQVGFAETDPMRGKARVRRRRQSSRTSGSTYHFWGQTLKHLQGNASHTSLLGDQIGIPYCIRILTPRTMSMYAASCVRDSDNRVSVAEPGRRRLWRGQEDATVRFKEIIARLTDLSSPVFGVLWRGSRLTRVVRVSPAQQLHRHRGCEYSDCSRNATSPSYTKIVCEPSLAAGATTSLSANLEIQKQG